MERLSDRFGEMEGDTLAGILMETAENAVEDNLQDYTAQLKDCIRGSFLEELDDFNIEVIYKRLAVNSVSFMLMSRCGLDAGAYFEHEDFADITSFNAPATLNAIGIATSDIEPEIQLGRYAQMHRDYLEQHKRVTYLNLLTSGRLNAHLYQTEQAVLQRLELLTKQLLKEQGVTEELKEKAPMQWVGLMNNIRSQAEEIILNELIYK